MPPRRRPSPALAAAVGVLVAARRRALTAALLVAVLVGPAPALADATLTFEDVALGTQLHEQQVDLPGDPVGSARGIEWAVRTDAPDGSLLHLPTVSAPVGVVPTSGSHVVVPPKTSCGGVRSPWHAAPLVVLPPTCAYLLTGRFPLAKQHVRVHVGLLPGASESYITARLLDVNGDELSSHRRLVAPGRDEVLDVSSTSRNGVYLTVEGERAFAAVPFWVDDVSFDAPVDPPDPDFGITLGDGADPQEVRLVGTGLVTVPIHVNRANRNAGPIRLTVSGVPARVTATLRPVVLRGLDASSSLLRLRAGSAALDGKATVTVTATPVDATAGAFTRRRTIALTVEQLKYYDAQINGMEITQGTQYADIPTPDPADPSRAVAYRGVQLVAGRRTVVRVFANNARAVPVDGLPALVVLRGYGKDGRELAGSPLYPVSFPKSMQSAGGSVVTDEIRRSNDQAFTFVLPDVANGASGRGVWNTNAVRLRAEVVGPGDTPSFVARTLLECGEPRCRANNAFTVTGVSWADMPMLEIWPVQVTGPQQGPPPSPWTVFDPVQTVTPMTVNVPYSYKVTISDDGLNYGGNRTDLQNEIFSRMEDAFDSFVLDGYLPVATGNLTPGATQSGNAFDPSGHDQPFVMVRGTLQRPLTSVSHEIGHALGRPHAGQNCPDTRPGDVQEGEPWPPDDMGFLQGYGMNTSNVGFGSPPVIISTTATQTAFDLMSYCAPRGPETGVWVSPRGWDEIVSRYRRGSLPTATRSTRRAGPTVPTLHVSAIVSGSTGSIAFVRPGPARDLEGDASGFRVVARDAANGLLAQAALVGRPVDDDDASSIILRGDLPQVDGIASVQLVAPGDVVLATLARSATKPVVRITAPAAGARVRAGKSLVVRWAASDADGDALRATLDYSIDDGRTWRTLGIAPSTGSFTLGARQLQGSRTARVRVRVRDTLDEVAAVSGRIRVDGMPPAVRIRLPRPNAAIRADAVLGVRGEAVDDGGASLTGKRLRWFANGRLVGRGEAASLRGLPPGRVVLRLVASDVKGRSGSATVRVRVVAVRPILVRFAAPKTLARGATRVSLVVATNVAARLTVRGQRFAVGPKAKAITVRVPRGSRALALALRLRAGGKSSTATVTIPRS